MLFDCDEARRWLRQSGYTLESSRSDSRAGFYSWACFKAHQVAEYALKGLLRGVGLESFGHDLLKLWKDGKGVCKALENLHECIALLNKMYIPPRYPDAWAGESVPFESYTKRDAEESIRCAEQVLRAVKVCVDEVCKDT